MSRLVRIDFRRGREELRQSLGKVIEGKNSAGESWD